MDRFDRLDILTENRRIVIRLSESSHRQTVQLWFIYLYSVTYLEDPCSSKIKWAFSLLLKQVASHSFKNPRHSKVKFKSISLRGTLLLTADCKIVEKRPSLQLGRIQISDRRRNDIEMVWQIARNRNCGRKWFYDNFCWIVLWPQGL